MNRELRDLHWRVFQVLRLLLPALLLLTLLGYRFPVTSQTPASLLSQIPADAGQRHSEEVEFGDIRFRLELASAPSKSAPGTEELWVRLISLRPLRQPDLHVYWSPRVSSFEEPPVGAILLGIWDPRGTGEFRMPGSASFIRGHIVVFSLGQNVLVAQAQLPELQ